MLRKLQYFLRSAVAHLDPDRFACPNCGEKGARVVDRKALVTALVRCGRCRLLYRTPVDKTGHNREFYQSKYSCGYTTDCPDAATLARLMSSDFNGSERDYGPRIEVLRALGVKPPCRLLDFGASWGYGTYQFIKAGYDAQGCEISKPRAQYAREMVKAPVLDDVESLGTGFDVFFSSHVLEHVPVPSETVRLAKRICRPGAVFVAFTPNGALAHRAANRVNHLRHWGDIHPNLLDDEFYAAAFPEAPLLLASLPYDFNALAQWDRKTCATLDLSGGELLCVTVL